MNALLPEAEPVTDPAALALFQSLAAAARDCAREIGLPMALEDEAVHAALKAAGHNLTTVSRQSLGMAAGFHTYPQGKWGWRAPDLRVFSTAPFDPRPQAAWDDCLWLSPRQLLTRFDKEKDG